MPFWHPLIDVMPHASQRQGHAHSSLAHSVGKKHGEKISGEFLDLPAEGKTAHVCASYCLPVLAMQRNRCTVAMEVMTEAIVAVAVVADVAEQHHAVRVDGRLAGFAREDLIGDDQSHVVTIPTEDDGSIDDIILRRGRCWLLVLIYLPAALMALDLALAGMDLGTLRKFENFLPLVLTVVVVVWACMCVCVVLVAGGGGGGGGGGSGGNGGGDGKGGAGGGNSSGCGKG